MKDTVKVRPLRPFEKIKIRRLKRQRRNTVNSRNARIIMLGVGHQRHRVIAEMVGCSAQWVRQIIHRFNDYGIDGISWYPWFQVRAARVFTIDICEHIAEIALSSPIALIGMTQWSVPKLRQYLIEQKVVANISAAQADPRWRLRGPRDGHAGQMATAGAERHFEFETCAGLALDEDLSGARRCTPARRRRPSLRGR